jgi:hypothetical protein
MSIRRFAALGLALATGLAITAAPAAARPSAGQDWSWDEGRFELGPRVSSLTLNDEDTYQGLGMGGAGAYARYRISRRWGLEGGLDVMVSDELAHSSPGDVVRVTAPFTASALLYLFPDWRFQMYVLGGVGVAAHSVRFDALGEQIDFATPIAQFGLGAQYRFGSVRLDASFRTLLMHRDAEDVERSPIADGDFDARPVAYQPYTGDRTVTGGMFTVGVHWGL